jgi:hypothetical protein
VLEAHAHAAFSMYPSPPLLDTFLRARVRLQLPGFGLETDGQPGPLTFMQIDSAVRMRPCKPNRHRSGKSNIPISMMPSNAPKPSASLQRRARGACRQAIPRPRRLAAHNVARIWTGAGIQALAGGVDRPQ